MGEGPRPPPFSILSRFLRKFRRLQILTLLPELVQHLGEYRHQELEWMGEIPQCLI